MKTILKGMYLALFFPFSVAGFLGFAIRDSVVSGFYICRDFFDYLFS